ncbi:unnamed protein product [Staurois parvus]|uniref:Uncharacterized protein n=1 Tax=Staurois parvus TaxID=386267 RepID=A0ABN9EJG2_9NEOB|nr:unnamed protein product [Staurois parvus]
MGPPTDPGPSGTARVSKWSVRPWHQAFSPDDLGYLRYPGYLSLMIWVALFMAVVPVASVHSFVFRYQPCCLLPLRL